MLGIQITFLIFKSAGAVIYKIPLIKLIELFGSEALQYTFSTSLA